MHLNQCFFKAFEGNVSFSGTAGSPSGRERGSADAANGKDLEFQRFCGIAIVIPWFPTSGEDPLSGGPSTTDARTHCFYNVSNVFDEMFPFLRHTFSPALRKDHVLQRF